MKHGEDLFCRIPIGGCGGGVARRYEQRAEHRVGPKDTARSWKLSCWDIKKIVQQPLAVPPVRSLCFSQMWPLSRILRMHGSDWSTLRFPRLCVWPSFSLRESERPRQMTHCRHLQVACAAHRHKNFYYNETPHNKSALIASACGPIALSGRCAWVSEPASRACYM